MGQTITEKILSNATGETVSPGEIIKVNVDLLAGNDISMPLAIEEFKKIGVDSVFDRARIAIVMDHLAPHHDLRAASLYTKSKLFAQEHGITNFFGVGRSGVMHALLPEKGLVLPGDVIVGGDSHTCTYGGLAAFAVGMGSTDLAFTMATGWTWLKVPETKRMIFHGRLNDWVTGKDLILYAIGDIGMDGALYEIIEFTGEVIQELNMDERFTIANMAVEAGAKTGIIEPDEQTKKYVEERASRDYKLFTSSNDAKYADVIEYDCKDIEPQVAVPNSPGKVKPISDVQGIKVDQVVIGSCTNGRLNDLRQAAKILDGKQVHPDVRLLVTPSTQEIYLRAEEEGLIKTLLEAGATLINPGCGACFGARVGVLDEGEIAISTTNRNFIGRMGHPSSKVFLSSPAIAAATAIKGQITHPNGVVK